MLFCSISHAQFGVCQFSTLQFIQHRGPYIVPTSNQTLFSTSLTVWLARLMREEAYIGFLTVTGISQLEIEVLLL